MTQQWHRERLRSAKNEATLVGLHNIYVAIHMRIQKSIDLVFNLNQTWAHIRFFPIILYVGKCWLFNADMNYTIMEW